MIRTIGPARLGFAAALLALLLGPLALGFHSAHAQGPNVASYYGTGLSEGDAVAASIGGTECASTTANAAGEWVLQVGPDGDCSPEADDTVNFSLNGDAAEQTATWSAGDLAEVSLTVAAMPDDDDDAMPSDDARCPASRTPATRVSCRVLAAPRCWRWRSASSRLPASPARASRHAA